MCMEVRDIMKIRKTIKPAEAGFALLISLIVVGVVLSVGMTILDLSIKQVELATNTRESEVSFHAANAGAECARYWRKKANDEMVVGVEFAPSCFDKDPTDVKNDAISLGNPGRLGNGRINQYEYEFTWGDVGAERCSQINTIVIDANSEATTTLRQVPAYILGFPVDSFNPNDLNYECSSGSQCTLISIRGYNEACRLVNSYGTVQREVFLQF